jgi:hypothetical protein
MPTRELDTTAVQNPFREEIIPLVALEELFSFYYFLFNKKAQQDFLLTPRPSSLFQAG